MGGVVEVDVEVDVVEEVKVEVVGVIRLEVVEEVVVDVEEVVVEVVEEVDVEVEEVVVEVVVVEVVGLSLSRTLIVIDLDFSGYSHISRIYTLTTCVPGLRGLFFRSQFPENTSLTLQCL